MFREGCGPIGDKNILLVGQMHPFSADGCRNDWKAPTHTLSDFSFYAGAKAQGRDGEEARFQEGFEILYVTVGHDVFAGKRPDAVGHLTSNDMQLHSRQLLDHAWHDLGSEPEHGVHIRRVFEPPDKETAPAAAVGPDYRLRVVNHGNNCDAL